MRSHSHASTRASVYTCDKSHTQMKLLATRLSYISWKEKLAERCKQTLQPITDKDLEIETVKIPRPINLDLIKENINCPINIEIDTAQHKHEENKKCNSKFKCLNKDLFDVFYDDYIDFKNYINDTLKLITITTLLISH